MWTHGPLLLVVSHGGREEDLDPDTAQRMLVDAARLRQRERLSGRLTSLSSAMEGVA